MNNLKEIILSIGSNLDDPIGNVKRCEELIAGTPGIKVIRKSSLYLSKPWGVKRQNNFINSIMVLKSRIPPLGFLELIAAWEAAMGRRRIKKWGPRVIDIDIIFHGGFSQKSRKLTIPHPRYKERAFVLLPLLKAAPRFVIPGTGKTVKYFFGKLSFNDIMLLESR